MFQNEDNYAIIFLINGRNFHPVASSGIKKGKIWSNKILRNTRISMRTKSNIKM